MCLWDVECRISGMGDCGQVEMGEFTAKSHGMAEELEELGGWDDSKVTVDPSWSKGELIIPCSLFSRNPAAEGDFEEPTGDYYEDAAAFEASERDAVWDREEEAANAAVDPFAVGLGTEDMAANGDEAWGEDFDLHDSDLGGDDLHMRQTARRAASTT
ncbi:Coatomer subunit alpha WD40 repeat containing protein [Gracilaria domingensis]|nr:Coatomer subunit alpha WD40 repeat containing protein [Gracilaria domingensis]